jgi:hypothetical protein
VAQRGDTREVNCRLRCRSDRQVIARLGAIISLAPERASNMTTG